MGYDIITNHFIKYDPEVIVKMTTYKIKFNIEGGKTLELDLDNEQFDKISAFCDQVMPDKKWKTENIKPIEA